MATFSLKYQTPVPIFGRGGPVVQSVPVYVCTESPSVFWNIVFILCLKVPLSALKVGYLMCPENVSPF